MQNAYIRNKLYLYGSKVILVAALILVAQSLVHAQKFTYAKRNNPNYDDRKFSYGFLIGIHTTTYQIKYSDQFTTKSLDSVYAVEPSWKSGFSLGFIVNYRMAEFFDLRITPKFAFYEHHLKYSYINAPSKDQLVETVMVEIPLLLKYKSERRGNVRMYMVGGVNPSIEASGRRQIDNTRGIDIRGSNLSLEAGFGFDLYYPLFKFSPEIRFSRGIVNMLSNTSSIYAQPLSRINTNTISIYFLFQ